MDSNEMIWTNFSGIRNGTEAFFDYVIALEPQISKPHKSLESPFLIST